MEILKPLLLSLASWISLVILALLSGVALWFAAETRCFDAYEDANTGAQPAVTYSLVPGRLYLVDTCKLPANSR